MKPVLVLLWCAAVATAQEWTVRTVNIVPEKGRTDEGIKTKIRIDANKLVWQLSKARPWDIPFSSITGLSHDVQARNLAAAYGDNRRCNGYGCVGDLMIMAVLAPFHARWEYVSIRWRDNGVPRTTYFRFRNSDFASFEREITTRTDLKFEDAGQERAAIRREILRRKSEALPLRVDRGTFLRNEPIPSGSYQILITERDPGTGDLYLLRGKKISKKTPMWVIPVSIVTGAETEQTPEPQYTKRRWGKSLEAIRMPGRTVRVMP